MTNETWKRLDRFPDYYISSYGQIIKINSDGTGKTIKPFKNGNGYLRVHLWQDGQEQREYLHRLIAEAFIENPENKPQVNHIDCDRENNRVDNLEWVTRDENMKWMSQCNREGNKKKRVIGVHAITGEVIEFESTQEAQRYGFWSIHVSNCCRGKLKTHKGYKFHYA